MKNKNIILLTSLLALGTIAPAFATESKVSSIGPDANATLEEIMAHSRVSVGASREGVRTEMRDPDVILTPDVWVYTGVTATNVYGAERFDTLVVIFKDDLVAKITLTNAEQVRTAAARTTGTAAKVAKR